MTAASRRAAAQNRDLVFRCCGLIGNAHKLADGSLDLTALVSLARRELREVLEPAELLVFLATVAADLVRTVAEIRDVPFDACLESLQTHLLTANREV